MASSMGHDAATSSEKPKTPPPCPGARSSRGAAVVKLGLVLVLIVSAFLLTRDLLWRKGVVPGAGATLPVGAAVPSFSLVRQDGSAVSDADLRGKVWVADFIFTRCAGPCPKLSARMQSLQYALGDRASRVRLVSFSLDPHYDRPSVLRRYAKRFHADPNVWWFLTNDDEKAMHDLVRKGFFQTVFPARKDAPLTHSNYLVVVDSLGRIRSAHDGLDSRCKALVLHDIDLLIAEKP